MLDGGNSLLTFIVLKLELNIGTTKQLAPLFSILWYWSLILKSQLFLSSPESDEHK